MPGELRCRHGRPSATPSPHGYPWEGDCRGGGGRGITGARSDRVW